MAKTSPTQRTLKVLRGEGCVCGIVEKWNQFAMIRQDLFGFIDLVALRGNKIVGVQCCAGSGHADHRRKILAEPRHRAWLAAGGEIELRSWRKIKVTRGGKAERWAERVEYIRQSVNKGRPPLQKFAGA